MHLNGLFGRGILTMGSNAWLTHYVFIISQAFSLTLVAMVAVLSYVGSSYSISQFALIKLSIYIGLCGSVSLWLLHSKDQTYLPSSMVRSLAYVLFAILTLVLLRVSGVYKDPFLNRIYFLMLSAFFPFFFLIPTHWVKIAGSLLSGLVRFCWKYVFIVMALCAVGLPALCSRTLNSESYVDVDGLSRETLGFEKKDLSLSLTRPEGELVAERIRVLKGFDLFSEVHVPIVLGPTDHGLINLTASLGPDLSAYCLFLRTDQEDRFRDLFMRCRSSLDGESSLTFTTKLARIREYPVFDPAVKAAYLQRLEDTAYDPPAQSNANRPIIEVMTIRGYYFHHYNAILRAVRGPLISAYSNQYGMGPIFLVRAISDISGLKTFDAVFISIFVFNGLVLLLLVMSFGLDKLLLAAFSISIVLVYCISNDLAPFLYGIRYLPEILIFTLFTRQGGVKRAAAIFSFVLLALYCKEYALLALCAAGITFVATRSRDYLLYSLVVIAVLVMMSVIASSSGVEGANLKALLSGFGTPNGMSPTLIMWVMMHAFVLKLLIQSRTTQASTIFLYLFFIFLNVKYVTNLSANHIGFLVLLVALLIRPLLSESYGLSLKVLRSLIALIVLVILLESTQGLYYLKYVNPYSTRNYESAGFTSLFQVDKALKSKASAFEPFAKLQPFLLSQNDDFIQVYFDMNLTFGFQNVSTNINTSMDLEKFRKLFDAAVSPFVLVDNDLLDDHQVHFLLKDFYNQDNRLNKSILGYVHDRQGLVGLWASLRPGLERVGGNNHFTLFKRSPVPESL